jgi:NADPH-dependent 2,4-dienoyl-CoA reductase/sulfur reductase-like enzyme/rhodanese-related sulfurtransferase
MPNAKTPRILIVGASAAGLKAGARAARLDPSAAITVLERRTFFSYGACGLPYYVGGDVDDAEELRRTAYGSVRDEGYFAAVKGLDVCSGWTAVGLDREARAVTARRADGSKRSFEYDRLVVATGARARTLPGIELGEHVLVLHTPEDARALRRGLETGQVATAIVVGGGFIGVELAVALGDMWGCEVTILEAEDRLLPQMLDREMADLVSAALAERGVTVRTGCPVIGARSTEGGAVVEAGGALAGEPLEADRAVVALGVAPECEFARAAGLAVGRSGGLVVDDRLRTSDPDIFAAGDCVEVTCAVSGAPRYVPLGSLANRAGRVVGDNLVGLKTRFPTVAGSACVKVFDLNVAATGLSEAAAARAGLAARSAWGTFYDVAHYYPEVKTLHLKLVYERESGRVLGLQAVGAGDAVKRIDLVANLLRRGGEVAEILDLEFGYSPPFNAALDPLHGIAATALNQERFAIPGIAPSAEPEGRLVLDVRRPEEIAESPSGFSNALEIACEEVRARVAEIRPGTPLLVVCEKGPRSAEIARWLQHRGFDDVAFLAGGISLRTALRPRRTG